MINIGINTEIEEFDHKYQNIFSNGNYTFYELDFSKSNDVYNEVDKLDGILLKEESGNIEDMYSLILNLKEKTDSFIWVLSKKTTPIHRVIYLQLGADGNFSEEDAPEELVLTIRNSVQRYKTNKPIKVLKAAADLEVHVETERRLKLLHYNLSVLVNGKEEISLTKLEFKALQILYENANMAVTYEELYQKVWESKEGCNKYRIANLIFHIREKLEQDTSEAKFIKTIRSKGYMLMI